MAKPAIIRNGKLYGDINLGRLSDNEATEAVRVRGDVEVITWWANPRLKTVDRGRMLKELFDKYADQEPVQPSLF